jgi:hypothetical protein
VLPCAAVVKLNTSKIIVNSWNANFLPLLNITLLIGCKGVASLSSFVSFCFGGDKEENLSFIFIARVVLPLAESAECVQSSAKNTRTFAYHMTVILSYLFSCKT